MGNYLYKKGRGMLLGLAKEILDHKKVKDFLQAQGSKLFDDRMVNVLEKINKNLEKANSLKYNFWNGVMRGLGTAIGATVIAAIIISILSKTIDSLQDVPVLNKLIKSANIESIQKDNKQK